MEMALAIITEDCASGGGGERRRRAIRGVVARDCVPIRRRHRSRDRPRSLANAK